VNWDDVRFVLAAVRQGTLLGAARELGVEHTTVSRRIQAAENVLGAKLFARGKSGLTLTFEGQRLLEPMQQVGEAVESFMRRASAEFEDLQGSVRITSPETIGISWLAPRLATFARSTPGLRLNLDPSGQVLDLSRGQAEVALRFFRTSREGLISRKVGTITHGLYVAKSYVSRYPVRGVVDLKNHPCLSTSDNSVEAKWLSKLMGRAQPCFTSPVTIALLNAAKAGGGIAVLPRYLGDCEPDLKHISVPDEPSESIWLTVHRDLRNTPRIRAVMDYLVDQFEMERAKFAGR